MVCHSFAEIKNLFFSEVYVKKFVFMSLCLKILRMVCHSFTEIKNLFFSEVYVKNLSLCHYV